MTVINEYDRIRRMPTVLMVAGEGRSHESVLRAWHILFKVKELLAKATDAEVVLELIDLMESKPADAEVKASGGPLQIEPEFMDHIEKGARIGKPREAR